MGSPSFTQTLRKVAGARAPQVQKMFRYFNSFMDAEHNDLDAQFRCGGSEAYVEWVTRLLGL